MIVIGSLYVWGSISIYVSSYYRNNGYNVFSSDFISFLIVRGVIVFFLLPITSSVLAPKYGSNKF